MNLSGQRFGRLVAIEPTEQRISKRVVWRCQCDCGNVAFVTSSHLRSGHTTSCGCARKLVNYDDITGQKFGRLTVTEPTDDRSGNSVKWRCKCDCGKEAVISAASLKSGNTTSCGCVFTAAHKEAIKKGALKARQEFYIDGTDVLSLTHNTPRKNNTGHIGVHYSERSGLYIGYITFKGKRYHLGYSRNIKDMIEARAEAEKRMHGAFLDWYYNEYLPNKNKPTSSE